jgi:hypothetical protein
MSEVALQGDGLLDHVFEAERPELDQEPGPCMHVHVPRMLESDVFVDLLFSSLLLSELELSDTTVYAP